MKTKRLSLLLVLALCVTIGGVYAAWVYAETPMTAVHGHIGSTGLANASVNNSKGTITVNADAAHLVIDQTDTNDYTAKLTATGDIAFVFTPSQIFRDSNPDLEAVEMEYRLTTTNAAPTEFKNTDGTEKNLFTKFDTTTTKSITLTKNGDVYTATISAEALLEFVEINTFKLDTYEKYQAFSIILGTFGNIGVELSEPTA